MTDGIHFHAPVELEMKVHLTDGERTAAATVVLPVGRFPTETEIRDGIANAVEAMQKQGFEGFRSMTKREFWDHYCIENFGGTFAMSGANDFDEVAK